ncbi:hypothetical protein N0V83_001272 [Neocucurbitaria cava]|uniref:BTB domain-containing protein n=1 Tax=Neocucurbitaria cava TaxID=798079 RepID=A0A9W8YF98_9PLEO|nr:hypothetical protein N0V83_001272 [Neocucurbitaria cava]
MVLLSKSSWFVQQIKGTTAISRNSFEVFHEGLSSSCLAHFKHPHIKACGDHEVGTPCLLENYLNDMFHFCYLDEYPPRTRGWEKTDAKGLCLSHIFMYMLGLHFGVKSLLERCVDGFTSTITSLDGKEKPIAHFINIIFELPDLKADDPLLMAARSQTKILVRGELGPIHSQFTSQIWDHRFTKAMPNPIKDYLTTELGLDKLDSAGPDLSNLGASTLDAKCARCASAFDIKESKAEPKQYLMAIGIYTTSLFFDFTFTRPDGEKIPVHIVILAAKSPIFKYFFESGEGLVSLTRLFQRSRITQPASQHADLLDLLDGEQQFLNDEDANDAHNTLLRDAVAEIIQFCYLGVLGKPGGDNNSSGDFKVDVLDLLVIHALAAYFEMADLVSLVETKFKNVFAAYCNGTSEDDVNKALQLCSSPEVLRQRHIQGRTLDLFVESTSGMVQQQMLRIKRVL